MPFCTLRLFTITRGHSHKPEVNMQLLELSK